MKKLGIALAILFLTITVFVPQKAQASSRLADTSPSGLIAAVNALRAANGLPPYTTSPILMSVAQAHAQYMANSGSVTHYGADGSRPYQRALAAGYPVGGDLSLGGFYSENIIAGNNVSVQDAIKSWQGDSAHLTTMLSADLTQIGAGSVVVGEYVYYDIDCARPANGPVSTGAPPASTASSSSGGQTGVTATPAVVYTIPNTPAADGSITHIVKSGETLWSIAVAYGVPLDAIRLQNKLDPNALIYVGQKLIIRTATTSTPGATQAANTQSPATAVTPLYPTWTPQPSLTPTVVPVQAAPSGTSILSVGVIVLAALVLAGILARGGRH